MIINDDQRTAVLTSLITFDEPWARLATMVRELEWDSATAIVTLTRKQAKQVLGLVIGGSITSEDLSSWANLIEGREDIDLDVGDGCDLRDFIYEAANPIVEGPLNSDWLERWYALLS